ncbi:MAG TPA: helix-turn-helix transcriptional regulator [Opitutales bacterium]|jgi:HTH-type transcriptional regulator/antitoxin HipB|nr:helix-turn-helix transcriptional regulator [Opitutales bacterium]
MSDIEKYIRKRRNRNPRAWADFDAKYRQYALGLLLAEHRQKAGLTLSVLAKRMRMQKSALSRLENHGEDMRLSTIARYVDATRRPLSLKIYPGEGATAKGAGKSAFLQFEST